jgi:hypothetical protein
VSTPDTSTDAFAATRWSAADAHSNGSAIHGPAVIPAVKKQRCYAGQVASRRYLLTDRTYQSAFLIAGDDLGQ